MSLKSFFKNMFGLGQKVEVVKDSNDSRDDKLEGIFSARENEILTSLRQFSDDREARINDYREMLKDGVTMSAVELISEDASLIDADTGLAAWIDSTDNPDFAEMATDFLKNKLRINDIIYPLAFNIVAFGECFLNTNYANEGYRKEYNGSRKKNNGESCLYVLQQRFSENKQCSDNNKRRCGEQQFAHINIIACYRVVKTEMQ